MPKTRESSPGNPDGISPNTGWHTETVNGARRRVSHNPRLSERYPEIAAQWHPELNGEKTADDVTGISTYRAFWLCELGHEWQCKVHRRTIYGSNCPQCNLNASSLATLFPELAKEWSTKNGALTPDSVRSKSGRLVWWSCPVDDHDDYQHTVTNRTAELNPLGCPVCAGIKPERSGSFASLFPNLAKEWHPVLNENLDPHTLTPGSVVTVWWRCLKKKEHEWPAAVFSRTRNEAGCPYCRLWYVSDENRLSVKFPEIAAEWHPKKNRMLWQDFGGNFKVIRNLRIPPQLKIHNRRLRSSDVATNCDEMIWWKCSAHGHVWQETVENRALRKRNCPECAVTKLANEESLAALFPALAKLWHPTRNLPLRPTDILPGSATMVYWRCPKSATHVWKAKCYSVVRSWKNGTNGCRWCSGLSADELNSLQDNFPEVAKLWHPTQNKQLLPSQVSAYSNKKVWWRCPKPKHDFEADVCNMVASFKKGATLCRFCSGRLCTPENSLEKKMPELAKQWHHSNELSPTDVGTGSNQVVTWFCGKGHTWTAKVSQMVLSFRSGSKFKGCPDCSGKR